MNNSQHLNLGNVQKTLILPLWGRAVESKKSKPRLIDQTAINIIEQIDYDFSNLAQNMDELTQIAWIKRSLICDQVIRSFLTKYPTATVVNIGCGLDTTFDRVDNGTITWFDLDLPDVIELRSQFIRETERRKFIASSFLESAWLERIQSNHHFLFIAAGVFYYFEEPEIKAFLRQLVERFPGSEILFDACSPTGIRVANKKVIENAGMDEKSYLQWGLKNPEEMLAWHPGIRLIKTYHYYQTFDMSLRNILLGRLSDFLGIQYMLHLKLGS